MLFKKYLNHFNLYKTINMIYQNFIIYINYEDYNEECKIFYTNYKIILLIDDMKKIKKIKTDEFIDFLLIKPSINATILNHCKNIEPNTIILITTFLKEDILLKLNDQFLKYKRKFISNNEIKEQYFKYPIYWSCKAYVFHEISKQITFDKQNSLELSLNALDILNGQQYVFELFESYKMFDIITIDKQQRIKCKKTDILLNIIFATYSRNHYLDKIINSLENQTNKNIHLHILDNNTDKNTQKGIDTILSKHNKIKITLYRYNINYNCISRIFLIKKLFTSLYMEYIVIFDDDQIHHDYWIERLLKECKPLSTLSWYGKVFDSVDYWNTNSKKEKIISYQDIEHKRKDKMKLFKYFGPGGCIFDANLFYFNELFDYNKYSTNIYKIDDIWMSFIFDKYLNIPLKRMFYHPLECTDRKDIVRTWKNAKSEKNDLFNIFHKQYNWEIIKPSRKYLTLNNSFDCIYVLYSSNQNLKTLKLQLSSINVCAHFVYSLPGNINTTKMNIFYESFNKKYDSIVIFEEDIVFHNFIHFHFDNIMKQIPELWNVLYLGIDKEMDKNGYYELVEDTTNMYAVAYSSNAIEELLSFHNNNKNMLIENKLNMLTNIRCQYVFSPSIIKLNSCKNLMDYNFKNYMNMHVNVYLFNMNNIPCFNYSNYTIKSIKEINNLKHFVVINNDNLQLNPDILGNGLYELNKLNETEYYPTSLVYNGKNYLHNSLIDNTISKQNKIGFFSSGSDIDKIINNMNK